MDAYGFLLRFVPLTEYTWIPENTRGVPLRRPRYLSTIV